MNPLKRLYHHHGVSDPRFYLNNRVHENCDHGCRGHQHSAEFLLQQKSNYQTFLDKYNIEMNACTRRGGWYFGVSSPKVLLCDTNKADCSSVMSWEMASHSLALWWVKQASCYFLTRTDNTCPSFSGSEKEKEKAERLDFVHWHHVIAGVSVFSHSTVCEHCIYFHTDVLEMTNRVPRCLLRCIFNNTLLFRAFSGTYSLIFKWT